jgi:hypothetical protein
MWGALSDEKSGLQFSVFAGYRQLKVKVKVILRLTVSQSVCLGVGHSFGAHEQILLFPFVLPENCFALRLGAPSLTRGRVCNL